MSEFDYEHLDEAEITSRHKRDWPAWAPVWEDLIFSNLSDRAVRLYAALARYSGDRGAWPSRRTLAARLGRSVDSIDRAKAELLEAGWMTVEGQYRETGDGRQTANLYQLHQAAVRLPGRVPAPREGMQERGTKNDSHLNDTPLPPKSESSAEGRTHPSTPYDSKMDERQVPVGGTETGHAALARMRENPRTARRGP